MTTFRANSDYEENGGDLIRLRAGDEVSVVHEDQAWPGWLWATDEDGNSGYVPEEILTLVGFGSYEAMENFDPEVLAIKQGDRLKSLRHVHGWHWCRNESGAEGWVAGYLMKPD